MSRYVLGFVGQNANGILRWWTEKVLNGFTRHGYEWRLIDLMDATWPAKLGDIMNAGAPEFCFSFQGMGMDIKVGVENAWTRAGIPFLTYLGDNPCHAPRLHAANAPGMYLLYGCRDFQQTYQRFLNGRAYSAAVPTGYPENPLRDRIPWKKRQHDIVFAKTGTNPALLRAAWEQRPAKIRDILRESADLVLSGADDMVSANCARVFETRGIHWGEMRELFLSVCSTIDMYARAVRAERMVKALMPHNALIVGDWSHLDCSNSRARFLAPIAATALDGLYADSRIVANTLPSVRFGSHERIMAGLLSKCAVVSESTPWLTKTMSPCPAFFGLNIDVPSFEGNLSDALQTVLNDPATAERTELSLPVAREMYSMETFVNEILSYVELEKYRKTELDWWAFPPRN